MFAVAPMIAAHAMGLVLRDEQSIEAALLRDSSYVDALIEAGPAYTALVDGRVVGCGGCCPIPGNMGEAWTLIGRDAAPHLLRITMAAQRFLYALRWPRIQTHVVAEFEQGHRWARLVGFVEEQSVPRYTPDGRDAVRYVLA